LGAYIEKLYFKYAFYVLNNNITGSAYNAAWNDFCSTTDNKIRQNIPEKYDFCLI